MEKRRSALSSSRLCQRDGGLPTRKQCRRRTAMNSTTCSTTACLIARHFVRQLRPSDPWFGLQCCQIVRTPPLIVGPPVPRRLLRQPRVWTPKLPPLRRHGTNSAVKCGTGRASYSGMTGWSLIVQIREISRVSGHSNWPWSNSSEFSASNRFINFSLKRRECSI
jgi:hypothetical protein